MKWLLTYFKIIIEVTKIILIEGNLITKYITLYIKFGFC